ncbi:substrate-binding domain-containing protein [Mesorhizobium caraganae]|uniref:substrate-binding domain-containing protein n=1 Tax=Mesorhizobium caraganae TaxID=483206 RepID=UPI00193A87A2|nr:substrate-binding domain-containing protein [Mesorhizobium caraganae]MBM2715573.1 substrate-binding domain-containing protein [Mesorhizobium caraganae]
MIVVGSFNGSRRRTPRRPVWIKTDTKNGQNQKSAEALGRDAAARLFSRPQTPNAIFGGNDQIAGGACDTLREIGLAVPTDVAIVGFDNWDVMVLATRPQLASIDVNLNGLGREAADSVSDSIFTHLGGGPPIRAFVCQFHDLIETGPANRGAWRWLGGPKDWCDQLRPCFIRLHPSLPIYADVHAQWLEATRRALEPRAIGPQFAAQLHQHLTQIADAMAAR